MCGKVPDMGKNGFRSVRKCQTRVRMGSRVWKVAYMGRNEYRMCRKVTDMAKNGFKWCGKVPDMRKNYFRGVGN